MIEKDITAIKKALFFILDNEREMRIDGAQCSIRNQASEFEDSEKVRDRILKAEKSINKTYAPILRGLR